MLIMFGRASMYPTVPTMPRPASGLGARRAARAPRPPRPRLVGRPSACRPRDPAGRGSPRGSGSARRSRSRRPAGCFARSRDTDCSMWSSRYRGCRPALAGRRRASPPGRPPSRSRRRASAPPVRRRRRGAGVELAAHGAAPDRRQPEVRRLLAGEVDRPRAGAASRWPPRPGSARPRAPPARRRCRRTGPPPPRCPGASRPSGSASSPPPGPAPDLVPGRIDRGHEPCLGHPASQPLARRTVLVREGPARVRAIRPREAPRERGDRRRAARPPAGARASESAGPSPSGQDGRRQSARDAGQRPARSGCPRAPARRGARGRPPRRGAGRTAHGPGTAGRAARPSPLRPARRRAARRSPQVGQT